tara:strand:- start:874 stop:981 length:108 start_codon:yes stop_codon:yes gene_type:complete
MPPPTDGRVHLELILIFGALAGWLITIIFKMIKGA